ncbi:MAG TPA: tetratricopeptide repeat protein [Rhizomicrobium sp.]
MNAYQNGLRLSAAGRHLAAIECYEQALAARPDDTKVLFALGNTARLLDMPGPAEEFFRRVLAAEPQRIEALVNLANLLRTRGQFDAAIALLEPVLAHHPDACELWLTLGSAHREKGENDLAESHYRQALAQNGGYAPALGNLADLLADKGDFETALALYDRALKSDGGNAQARLNRAVLHLLRGNLKDGWRDYTARLKIANKVPLAEHRLERWNGGRIKRLLVSAEQGVGDQIMFASCLPDLAARAAADGGMLLLECEPRLVSLFARSFPNVTVRPSDLQTKAGVTTARYDWLRNAGGANHFVEMGSVPKILRASLEAFPQNNAYLTPDTAERAHWQGILAEAGPGPHTGICWRSGKSGGHRAIQYAPLDAWAEFLHDLPGTLVCAQYDASAEEIAELEKRSGRKIFAAPGLDQKNELDRTAAMLSSLDAVVSAPTAVSWLAAGCGVTTLKILYDTSWTAFGQAHEPFAPACLCVMPDMRGDWRDAFAKAQKILSEQP